MISWVDEFGFIQWLIFGILVAYSFLWITGASFLKDPEKRFPRIESLDDIYLSEIGVILFQIRNLLIWCIILVIFLILT